MRKYHNFPAPPGGHGMFASGSVFHGPFGSVEIAYDERDFRDVGEALRHALRSWEASRQRTHSETIAESVDPGGYPLPFSAAEVERFLADAPISMLTPIPLDEAGSIVASDVRGEVKP